MDLTVFLAALLGGLLPWLIFGAGLCLWDLLKPKPKTISIRFGSRFSAIGTSGNVVFYRGPTGPASAQIEPVKGP